MLDPIIFITQSNIYGEPRHELPRILRIERPIVIAIVAVELRRSYRKRKRTRRRDHIGIIRIRRTRKLALRIYRCLKLIKTSIQEVVECQGLPLCGKILYCLLEGAKDAVVAGMDILPAHAQLMISFGPTKVLEDLIKVLRTAKRNRIAGT